MIVSISEAAVSGVQNSSATLCEADSYALDLTSRSLHCATGEKHGPPLPVHLEGIAFVLYFQE
jgi:hypothetical protein